MQSPTLKENYFSAIILTGWSRFDHFMPLCDIFPTAYPSLIYSLHVLNTNQFLANEIYYDCETLMKSVGKYHHLCKSLPGNIIAGLEMSRAGPAGQRHFPLRSSGVDQTAFRNLIR